jgi:hypothetical protein
VLVPLIRIRFTVEDAPMIGTLSLLLLGMWLALAARSENQTVGVLLRDTCGAPDTATSTPPASRSAADVEEQQRVLHAIEANGLFVHFDDSVRRIHSIEATDVEPPASKFRARLNAHLYKTISSFFYFFPVLVSFGVLALERASFFRPSEFALDEGPPGMEDPFFWPSLLVFLVLWPALIACCWRARGYSTATESVVRECRHRMNKALLAAERAGGLDPKA